MIFVPAGRSCSGHPIPNDTILVCGRSQGRSGGRRTFGFGDSNLLNNYYERPAVLGLLGEVEGRHVLDAGCGAGSLIAARQAKGATVAGFDASPAMIALARQRLGEDATLQVADLSQPLPFTDGAFDDVVASLVLTTCRTGQHRWRNFGAS